MNARSQRAHRLARFFKIMAESNLSSTTQEELFRPADLPAGHQLLTLDEDERSGRHTGERIARDRKLYQAIVRCLAEGVGIRATARAFGVATETVAGIRDREPALFAREKKELSQRMGHFVRMGVERLIEEVDQIPIGQLSVSVGVISDKKALLDGDPTVRVEERIEVALSPGDLRAMLENMKRAQPPVIDVEPAKPAVTDIGSTDSKPS